jgi:RNA recognition motif-containing protein
MNIYVGNLAAKTVESELRTTFESFGEVAQVNIIKDKFSGEPKGFGFVEMPSKEHAQAAIAGLNGKELNGRSLNVNEARPKTEGGSRGGGGGNRGGSGGNRGGGGGYNRSW